MEMRRLVLLLALLLNASCSTSAEDDWSWDVEVDGSTNSDLGFPDSSASVDVDANSPGVDGETVSLPESWPKVDEAGGGKSLLDLVMHAWGGVAAAPIEGELETTLAGDDWEQREGRLNWTEAQAIYGFAWGALQQFEGDAKCALEVDGEKLTVVNAPGPDESPGSSLSGTFQGSDLEANFSDFMATDAVTVEGAEFMALCAAAEGQPVALAQVYTLADSGAQMALSTGGLEALAKEVQSAAVLLAERRTLLCCEEGFYLTGYTGVLGAIADLEGVAATATCIWAEPAVPQSCGGACTAAADCREAQCSDGQDNDSDGATDCADEDCESAVCDGDGSICDEGECQTCESSGPEICDNGSDEDCDGKVDEGCDDDGDGWCDGFMETLGFPVACPSGPGDCEDQDGDIYPGAVENPADELVPHCR